MLAPDEPTRERARALFGDEREDYQAALDRHYEQGPPADWAERHVSAYATMHPSEDWAETFAHYLHIRDTLQTAAAYRVSTEVAVPRPPDAPSPRTMEALIADWLPLTYALNQLNRSMGSDDLYPFVLAARGDGQARARARPRRPPVTDRELAAAAATAAARIALARHGGAVDVDAKLAPTDVVSEVDREAEAAAIALIAAERPADGYLGEEGARRPGERTWIVDALDGTLNYLQGLAGWCAAVALEDEHGPLAAAVCDPVRGELFTAARGEGAACNGAPIAVADAVALDEAVVATFLHAPKRDLPGVVPTPHPRPGDRGLGPHHGLRHARARLRRRRPPARLDPARDLPLGLGPRRAARHRGGRPRRAHAARTPTGASPPRRGSSRRSRSCPERDEARRGGPHRARSCRELWATAARTSRSSRRTERTRRRTPSRWRRSATTCTGGTG